MYFLFIVKVVEDKLLSEIREMFLYYCVISYISFKFKYVV